MQNKNAHTNLKNRYLAVLKKCAMLNTFGSIALAAIFLAGVDSAQAANITNDSVYDKAQKLSTYDGNSYSKHEAESKKISGATIANESTANLTFLASRQDNKTTFTKVVAEEEAVIVNENSITVIEEKVVYVDQKKYSAWIQPMYQNIYSSDFEYETSNEYTSTSYTRNTFGINVGADITMSDNIVIGAAIQSGQSDSAVSQLIDNDAEFYGLSLYATYTMNALTVKADLGYIRTENQMSGLNAKKEDYSANSITLGAVAEYRLETEAVDLIPYAGLRLTNVNVDSVNYMDRVHFGSQNATVFSIPLGLRVEKEFMTDTGVSVIPHANVGFEFAFGDLDDVEAVTVVGVRNESRFMNNTFDPVTFQLGLGVEFVKEQYSFNLDYDYRLSNYSNEHSFMANFRYKF